MATETVPCGAGEWERLLDQGERDRIGRLLSRDARRDVMAAHALLRRQAGEAYVVDPALFRYMHDTTGAKPRLALGDHPVTDVNITHCLGLAASVMGFGCSVGIDAERIDRIVPPEALVPLLAQEEQDWLAAAKAHVGANGLMHLWTLKEAVMKCIALGLTENLSSFAVLPLPPRIVRLPRHFGPSASWRVWQFRPSPWHVVAIAARMPADGETNAVPRA